MGRADIRELIRQAQAAEIAGELPQAAALLADAAREHLEAGEGGRAASLLRHSLRLQPDRPDVEALLEQAEAMPAGGPPRRELEVPPQRGPTLADPAIDAWCSFCCRPKSEVGRLVAGPAGAYVCGRCVGAAGELLAVPVPLPAPVLAQPAPPNPPADDDFIENAVVLSKALGWSLAEVRSLTADEIRRAIKKLAGKKRP